MRDASQFNGGTAELNLFSFFSPQQQIQELEATLYNALQQDKVGVFTHVFLCIIQEHSGSNPISVFDMRACDHTYIQTYTYI